MEITKQDYNKALQDAENRGYIQGAAEMGARYALIISKLRLAINELSKKVDENSGEIANLIKDDIERIEAGRV